MQETGKEAVHLNQEMNVPETGEIVETVETVAIAGVIPKEENLEEMGIIPDYL